MKSTPASSRTHTGFTVLELLVVVAILILIIAILVPTVSGVKRSAGKATCIANLRQIGVGIQQYIAEQNGKLPPEPRTTQNGFLIDTLEGMIHPPGNSLGENSGMSVLSGPKVDWWICPNDPTRGGWQRFGAANGIPGDNEGERGINAHSYSANMALAYRRISEIPRPSQSIILADFPWGKLGTRGIWPGDTTWTNALPGEWHHGSVNCLFVDGHVQAIEVDTLALGKQNAYLWFADYPSSDVTPKTSY